MDTHSTSVTEVEKEKKGKKQIQSSTVIKKDEDPLTLIPGVHKLVLNEDTQTSVYCVVGTNISPEKPWIRVSKTVFLDHIELNGDTSEFASFKSELIELTDEEIMVGYAVRDSTEDHHVFYICATAEAMEAIEEIEHRKKLELQERLAKSICRSANPWESLGSENEIDETLIQKSRSLIEVEVESAYPIMPFPIRFRHTKAEQMRDGYMELRMKSDSDSFIFRRRTHCGTQVTPDQSTAVAQTLCAYPRNSSCQYEFLIDVESADHNVPALVEYIKEDRHRFVDALEMNNVLNLYENDCKRLKLNMHYMDTQSEHLPEEFMSFIDVNLSKGKMVSSLSWHPLWTGVVAAAYKPVAPGCYLEAVPNVDEVLHVIHGIKTVLLWSFTDELKPKLIFECHREVMFLQFCPHNENLLVGGCTNGQVILWDITGRLDAVEKEQMLTQQQLAYKAYMGSLMSWMKNMYSLSLVKATAVSNLQFSHKAPVRCIEWLSPRHRISRVGQVSVLADNQPHALQFLTASQDGYVLIWDLHSKVTTVGGGPKMQGRLQKLKKQPTTGGFADVSPFKLLHLNLKPVYQINIIGGPSRGHTLPVSTICAGSQCRLTYVKQHDYNPHRDVYKPHIDESEVLENRIPDIYLGTAEGEFVQLSWEGQQFDSGEIVNFEDCKVQNQGAYHDGPITSIELSTSINTILTVGGKIFALWREEFKSRPFIWRRSKSIYTYGKWDNTNPSKIILTRLDGFTENWSVFVNSKKCVQQHLLANGTINTIDVHPRRLSKAIFSICDHNGCLRCYHADHGPANRVANEVKIMNKLIEETMNRKMKFKDWQTQQAKRTGSDQGLHIQPKVATSLVQQVEPTLEPKKSNVSEQAQEKKPTNIRAADWIKKQHEEREQDRIKKIILGKKQVDTQLLLKHRRPLDKLEEQEQARKEKLHKMQVESSKTFRETVGVLFPDVVKPKPPPPIDPYTSHSSKTDRTHCFEQFASVSELAHNYVDEHPFQYTFNWLEVAKAGTVRRKVLSDIENKATHLKRHQNDKLYRNSPAHSFISDYTDREEVSIESSVTVE